MDEINKAFRGEAVDHATYLVMNRDLPPGAYKEQKSDLSVWQSGKLVGATQCTLQKPFKRSCALSLQKCCLQVRCQS